MGKQARQGSEQSRFPFLLVPITKIQETASATATRVCLQLKQLPFTLRGRRLAGTLQPAAVSSASPSTNFPQPPRCETLSSHSNAVFYLRHPIVSCDGDQARASAHQRRSAGQPRDADGLCHRDSRPLCQYRQGVSRPLQPRGSVANDALSVIQDAAPDFKAAEIGHLRRVVQFRYLPAQLQKQFYPPARLQRGIHSSDEHIEHHEHDEEEHFGPSPASLFNPLPPSDDESCLNSDEETCAKSVDTVRFFLLCPTRFFKPVDLVALLRKHPPFSTMKIHPKLLYVTIPSLAPTSGEQSEKWSEQYWPIAYKNTNPYGPHPSLVARNTAEIEPEAGEWLALAHTAAAEIAELGLGEKVGCVVVDRAHGTPEVVAIAGDCRWRSPIGEAETHAGTFSP